MEATTDDSRSNRLLAEATRHLELLERSGAAPDATVALRDLLTELVTIRGEDEDAQRETQWRERSLEQLLRTTQDAVVFIDRNARIRRFNRAAEEMFGWPADEVLGRNVRVLMPDPYRGDHDGHLRRYERTRRPRAVGRIRTVTGLRRTGETFPIEISVTAIDIGDEVRYAAFIRDLSEKARLQQELLDKERLATVGITASVFAHEVGNPLNNIYVHVQLLQRQIAKRGLDDLGHRVRGVVEEIDRLNALLEDFRSFYAREPTATTMVDVGALLEELVEFQTRRPEGPPIVFRTEIDGELSPIRGNRDKLTQVFLNLIKNAVEAMPDGGTLTVTARARADQVCVEIEDTGMGIPPGVDVFEPFRTTKPGGTGLGLPVVRKIVTAHGGTVTVRSEENVGTTFRVVLRGTYDEDALDAAHRSTSPGSATWGRGRGTPT